MTAATVTERLPTNGGLCRVFTAGGGIGISALILFALQMAQWTPKAEPPIEARELQAIALPPPPPPPPIAAHEPPPPQLMEMSPVPSRSPVRFALTIDPIEVPRMQAKARIEFRREAFKPQARALDQIENRVYNVRDVDRLPVPVFRKAPRVPPAMLRAASSPMVRLTFVVATDGRVEDVRVVQAATPEMGELVAAAIAEWQFEPAIKDGKKVRCVVLQPVRLHPPSGNPFSAH